MQMLFRLWSIHVGKPRLYYEYDPETKEYWYEIERHKEEQKNLPRKDVTFYHEPREHELNFISRLVDREQIEPVQRHVTSGDGWFYFVSLCNCNFCMTACLEQTLTR